MAEKDVVLIVFTGVIYYVWTYTATISYHSFYLDQVPEKTLLGPWLNNTEGCLTPLLVQKCTQTHSTVEQWSVLAFTLHKSGNEEMLYV